MIAGESCLPWSRRSSGGGGAVGDEAGDGLVGVGEAVSAVGPALELLPAFAVGEGVFDGDPLRGVVVSLTFSEFAEGCYGSWSQFAWWGEGLPAVVSAKAEVAVIEEDPDQVEVVEASADAGRPGGRVVHTPWP